MRSKMLQRKRKGRDHRLDRRLSLGGAETEPGGEIVDRLAALRALQDVVESHGFSLQRPSPWAREDGPACNRFDRRAVVA